MVDNHLEMLVSEWDEFGGSFVRRKVRFGVSSLTTRPGWNWAELMSIREIYSLNMDQRSAIAAEYGWMTIEGEMDPYWY